MRVELNLSGADIDTKTDAAARDGPKTTLATRPTTEAEATGFESFAARLARLDEVASSGDVEPPTRSSIAKRFAQSLMNADPPIVAPMVVSNVLGAAAVAASEGW